MIRHSEVIPQTAAWVGIVDGQLLLVRTYADGSLTAAIKGGDGRWARWGPEVTLEAEAV